jgi:O-succinylbenzoate synthase
MDFRFAFRRYSLPFRLPVRTAHGTWPRREGLYVRLERADGSLGFGEAAPIPGFGAETAEADAACCQSFGDSVSAEVLASVPENLPALRRAVADALAKAAVPRHRSLSVAALLPAGRAALEEAPPKAEAGFRVFKWKVGVGDAGDEQAILDDLIGALPAGSRIRLDANGAWDLRRAEQWLKHAADRPVDFVEQPLARDGRGAEDRLLGLAADYPVPIALDESIAGDADVRHWLDRGWKGYFVLKLALIGDAAGVLDRLARADARVVFSSALETGLGARSALHTAFAWAGAPSALGFGVWPLFADSRFDGPFAVPLLRIEEVDKIDPEALWNALT